MMDKRRKANALKRLASQLEQDLETALTLAKKVKEFACNVNENEKQDTTESLRGILNRYSNPNLRNKEKEAWKMAVKN